MCNPAKTKSLEQKFIISKKNIVNSCKLLHILRAIQMMLDIGILSRKTFSFVYIFPLMDLKLNHPNLSCLISYKILERVWGGSYLHCKRLINLANRQKVLWKKPKAILDSRWSKNNYIHISLLNSNLKNQR